MKSDDHTQSSGSTVPQLAFFLGTLGVLIATFCKAILKAKGLLRSLTLAAVDTDPSASQITVRLSAMDAPVALSPDELFQISPQDIKDLREALRREPRTRRYAERLSSLKNGSTRTGAAATPVAGLAAALVDYDAFYRFIGRAVEEHRNCFNVSDAILEGPPVSLAAPAPIMFAGNGVGGTGGSLAMTTSLIADEHLKRLEMRNTRKILLVSGSLLGDGADPAMAGANLASLERQIILSHLFPGRAEITGFGGRELKASRPLFDEVIPFGPGNGRLVAADRRSVAFLMARYVVRAVTGYGVVAEAFFQDAMAATSRLGPEGPRVFGRFGFAGLRYDTKLRDEVLRQIGKAKLARRLLSGVAG
jgi:hypothetical protein